jgi:sec-independent protein translocase protein TatA
MFGLGWPEVIVILVAMALIFGPRKIPEIGAAFGKTLRGFKEEVSSPTEDSSRNSDLLIFC